MSRVLPTNAVESLAAYLAEGGGAGLAAARAVSADTIIEEITASGLRGRGGAGFPTGVKWRTVTSFASPLLHTSVVVNAAEGEPGTFKDRMILRRNPYAVIEGALIAARAMDAKTVVIATKAAFTAELARIHAAVAEVTAAGWCDGVSVVVVEGPSEYLFGEETGLLEVIDGRPPFPRIAPPFRHGVVEVVGTRDEAASGSGLPADVQMAELEGQSVAPPVLVNNVETFANVPAIVARGAAWFREVGTPESPGTLVCTVTGAVVRPGVVEVAMGTTLRAVIDLVGGMVPGESLAGVMVGVSSPIITPVLLDTPLSYESMAGIGSGLGSAGFIVIGTDTDPVSLAYGAARFLSIESCGQCTHCKQDGGEIASVLLKISRGDGRERDLSTIERRLGTVADGARCSLGSQQRNVVGSILSAFDSHVRARLQPGTPATDPYPIVPLVDLGDEGVVLDETFVHKQPDWTYAERDSGMTPVDRFLDHRAEKISEGPTRLSGE